MRIVWIVLGALLALAPSVEAGQPQEITNTGACVVTGFAAGATSITVNTGCGATLPGTVFNASVCNTTDYPINCKNATGDRDPNYEIVQVTAGFGTDSLTISRAQESTSDAAHNTGGKVYWLSTFTAKWPTDVRTGLSAGFLTTDVNGVLPNENSGLTAGRIPYVATGPVIADAAELLWTPSASNGRVTIGTPFSPSPEYSRLVVSDTSAVTTYQEMREILKVAAQAKGSGDVRTGTIAGSFWATDSTDVVNKTITNAVSSGGPDLIRITATGHTFSTGDLINIYGVVGTTEANNSWTITVIDANTFDLQGSTHTNAYVSGGTATNAGQLVPVRHVVIPRVDRPFDAFPSPNQGGNDANGLTASNASDFKATDGFWITDERSTDASAWRTLFSSDSASDYFLRFTGKYDIAGIDLASAVPRDGTEPLFLLGSGHNFDLDSAGSGTKIGTSTSDKLGFWNATPVAQPSSTAEIKDGVLATVGLMGSGGAASLDLDGGTLTAARGVFNTGTITSSTPAVAATQTWNSGGTAFTGLSFGVTATAADPLSRFVDFTEGGESRYYLNHSGVQAQIAKNGQTTAIQLESNSGTVNGTGVAANTTVSTLSGEVSSGTVAQRLRSRSGQVALRNSAFGYGAVDDTTTATRSAAHRAAMDWVHAESWTTTAHGMFLRFRTTATGGTTTNAKAFISEQGLELSTGGSAPTARGTTNPTNALSLFDGTAPVGTLTNGTSLYSSSGEQRVMDAAGVEQMLSTHNKALTDNVAVSVVSMTVAAATGIGGVIHYTIEVYNGTDIQVETGQVMITAVNKAGVITAAATEVNSQQTLSSGTMTTAWAISAATPTVVSVNANTSLTPNAGYPRITFHFVNLGRQAFTLP